jgi:hypothetical protein
MSLVKLIVSISVLIFILSSLAHAQQDTGNFSAKDTSFVMSKSPWGAVLRSTVVPGWGQLYNRSYIKAVAVWGISGWLVYNWIINNDEYTYYRDLYSENPDREIFRRYRTFYRDQRDLFTIYIGLAYLLNLVDAYVDAHLFDFSVEEDFLTRSPRLNLKVKLF